VPPGPGRHRREEAVLDLDGIEMFRVEKAVDRAVQVRPVVLLDHEGAVMPLLCEQYARPVRDEPDSRQTTGLVGAPGDRVNCDPP